MGRRGPDAAWPRAHRHRAPHEAVDDLTAAAAVDPSNPYLWRWRAEAYDALGDEARARADRRMRWSPAGANDLAWRFVAGSLPLRDAELAVWLAERAAAAPEDRSYRNTLALSYLRVGRNADAIAQLREGMRRDGGRYDVFDQTLLGIALCREGRRVEALREFAVAAALPRRLLELLEREELADFLVEAFEAMVRPTSASGR